MWRIAKDVLSKEPFSAQCEVCGKNFSTKHGYSTHMAQHRGNFSYRCDVCDQGFMVKGALENHKRSHTGERLTCAFCDAKFMSYQGYKKHLKKHEINELCRNSNV